MEGKRRLIESAKKNHLARYFFLFCIILISAGVRIYKIDKFPGWYSDEGTVIDISKNLLEGNIQYLSLRSSTIIAARLPFFPLLLAGLFALFGVNIIVLRVLVSFLGVISVVLTYILVRKLNKGKQPYLDLLSAFIMGVFPQFITYGRIGFSYHLLSVLVLIALFGLVNYLINPQKRWVTLFSIAIGVGCVSDLIMFFFIPAALIVVSLRKLKDLPSALFFLLLPFSSYLLYMSIKDIQVFLFDFGFTMTRVQGIPLLAQIPLIFLNISSAFTKYTWFAIGCLGLFYVENDNLRKASLITFYIPIIFLSRTTNYSNLGFYYLIPLMPMVAIGFSTIIYKITDELVGIMEKFVESIYSDWNFLPGGKLCLWLRKRSKAIIVSLFLFLVVISPLAASYYQNFLLNYQTVKNVLVNSEDATHVIDFVNDHAADDDLVIASPALAWAIESNAADFQQSLAFMGKNTKHFPDDIPRSRFAFNASYLNAKFVILDPIWWNWAVPNMEEVEKMTDLVTQWDLVYQSGDVAVYKNPIK